MMPPQVVPIPDDILKKSGMMRPSSSTTSMPGRNTDINTHTIVDIPGLWVTHVTALSMPHCLADRRSIMTRFTEITFLNDDYYDKAGIQKANKYNDELRGHLKTDVDDEDAKASMAAKAQQLQAGLLVEMLQIDQTLASDVMATYSRILEAMGQPGKGGDIKTIEEYLPFRLGNSGIEVYQEMCSFGPGVQLSRSEKERLAPITNAALCSSYLCNDYCSWPKEVKAYFEQGDNPPSAPRQNVCEEAVAQQRTHLALIEELEKSEGPLSQEHRRYFEAAQCTASGSELWSVYTARYPTKAELNQPECILVGEILQLVDPAGTTEHPSDPQPVVTEVKKSIVPKQRFFHRGEERPAVGRRQEAPAVGGGAKHSHSSGSSNGMHAAGPSKPQNGTGDGFSQASNEIVLSPYQYLQVPRHAVSTIKKIVGLLHRSSLMLDDIEDDSALRRGRPCAHTLYGAAQTINSANYAFVGAFAEVQRLHSPSAAGIFISEVQNMHCGRAMDLSWKYHTHCPTVDEYMTMIDNKTGAMFRLCVRLMEAESTVPCQDIDSSHFVTQLGRYFQVRDDYQNLVSTEYTNQKGFCEDLDEGKISLPLIYTLMNPAGLGAIRYQGHLPAQGEWRIAAPRVKKCILEQMEEAGALDATRSLVRKMQTDLISELHRVEECFGSKNSLIELVLRRLWI
ncbi:terpenoid synthase [Aspergillus ellipticus CBS 707.79]|uniref:Terpenoid synthase n=1 Tax=Aspergillus ellipticus CBS 707.79 TaxID=1448320 RepID=A0A319CWB2_9EURO|nr:terpenoid synthase [Aspergillus ellipticus CBS 707.79]